MHKTSYGVVRTNGYIDFRYKGIDYFQKPNSLQHSSHSDCPFFSFPCFTNCHSLIGECVAFRRLCLCLRSSLRSWYFGCFIILRSDECQSQHWNSNAFSFDSSTELNISKELGFNSSQCSFSCNSVAVQISPQSSEVQSSRVCSIFDFCAFSRIENYCNSFGTGFLRNKLNEIQSWVRVHWLQSNSKIEMLQILVTRELLMHTAKVVNLMWI